LVEHPLPLTAMTQVPFDLSIADIVGTIGVALIGYAYLALVIRRLSSADLRYAAINAVGAALILFSLFQDFNFPAFLIELFWLITSLIGMGLAARPKRLGDQPGARVDP
jgi:hypothetical protein